MVAIDIYVPLLRACQNLLMEKTWVKVAAADSWRGSGADSQLPARRNKERKQELINKRRVKTWVICYAGKKAGSKHCS